MRHKALIIVPAFNEEDSLDPLLQEIRMEIPEFDIVVVDDGSTDRTGEIARRHTAHVIQLPFNLGIGGAVQTGFRFARSGSYQIAIQVDGDGQHPPRQIMDLVKPVLDGEADVTIGSRFLGNSGYRPPFKRSVGIAVFRILNSLLLRRPITDCTSGFRAYNRRTIVFLADNYPIDYPEPESVVTLARAGFRIKEIPVDMRVRQGGRSSISGFGSAYYMVKVVLAILMEMSRRPKLGVKRQ
ncbi:MAG: glycosyltransferase family 2 protein [Chloroflexi bacterium]|nr:glycosyltransferase family 2 protein [Chloroflexota bacterium]